MKKSMVILCAMLLVLCMVWPAKATIILEDHFDDGVLDPAWSISFENADGWSYSESGTNLTVTDISPTIISTDIWSRVILSRNFSPLNDFFVDFDFSWDSEGLSGLYQNVYVTLYDSSYGREEQTWEYLSANTIAYGGYQGPWGGNGQPVASVRDNQMPDPGPILPLTGSASIDISRVDGYLEFYWDDVLMVSGFDTTPLVGVDIEFWNCNLGPESIFGSESVDLVRIADAPVAPIPEPTTILLLGSGLIGLAGFRRKFRKQ